MSLSLQMDMKTEVTWQQGAGDQSVIPTTMTGYV
jgi:hypothetical protein